MTTSSQVKALLASSGRWYLNNTAETFQHRGALAGLWLADQRAPAIEPALYRRCRSFHAAMKPFYHLAPDRTVEVSMFRFFPLWKAWVKRQPLPEGTNVVHAMWGHATELFDKAEEIGALKVIDCPNSHPANLLGFWQREFDLWCPGDRIPMPPWFFARCNREIDRADIVLCPSVFVRDSMIWNGVPEEKCVLAPFGVDTSLFQKREKLPEKPRFIAVGAICLRKGFQYLFRAFEQVREKLPDAELVVVGEYKAEFRKERPKWEGRFTHFPHLGHGELAPLLRSCTAFVFPSTEEGFARVIVEAMGSGLPIIASYESGATTLVRDGREGLIVRPRRVNEIAEAMIRLAEDGALNERMGEAAHAAGANTWQEYGDGLLEEYERRLKGRREPREGENIDER